MNFLSVIVGGGIGAALRYLLSGVIQKHTGSTFPYGTLIVNLMGAFIIGFTWELFQNIIIPNNAKLFLFMGILGAFTTFSTFNLETMNMLRDKEIVLALFNILGSNLFCLILVFLGFFSARFLLKIVK
jgi:CrcB protein